jgi:hypothetical protein
MCDFISEHRLHAISGLIIAIMRFWVTDDVVLFVVYGH